MQLRSSLATLFVSLSALTLTMCSSDDSSTSNPSNSSDSCSCQVTVNGTGKEWSGCGKEACIGGVAYVCSTTGASKRGACDENDPDSSSQNPDPGDPDPSDPDPSDPDPSDPDPGNPSTPKDAGGSTPSTPTCDASKTFACGSTQCKLTQICVLKKSLCFDVGKDDQCTPCSTQYAVTKTAQCPQGYFAKLSGSSSTGCAVECQ